MYCIKNCQWLALNHRPPVLETAALPTESQPLPTSFISCLCFSFPWRNFWIQGFECPIYQSRFLPFSFQRPKGKSLPSTKGTTTITTRPRPPIDGAADDDRVAHKMLHCAFWECSNFIFLPFSTLLLIIFSHTHVHQL